MAQTSREILTLETTKRMFSEVVFANPAYSLYSPSVRVSDGESTINSHVTFHFLSYLAAKSYCDFINQHSSTSAKSSISAIITMKETSKGNIFSVYVANNVDNYFLLDHLKHFKNGLAIAKKLIIKNPHLSIFDDEEPAKLFDPVMSMSTRKLCIRFKSHQAGKVLHRMIEGSSKTILDKRIFAVFIPDHFPDGARLATCLYNFIGGEAVVDIIQMLALSISEASTAHHEEKKEPLTPNDSMIIYLQILNLVYVVKQPELLLMAELQVIIVLFTLRAKQKCL